MATLEEGFSKSHVTLALPNPAVTDQAPFESSRVSDASEAVGESPKVASPVEMTVAQRRTKLRFFTTSPNSLCCIYYIKCSININFNETKSLVTRLSFDDLGVE